MNNIPNDVLEEIILNKVKLFTKESYYRHFRSILLEFYKNILAFKKKASLSITMTSKIKERNNKSLWHIISIIIFPLKSQLNEENSYEREYNLNPLCFQYLKNLCFTRMKKLTNLATIERVSMDRVIPIYLNLCEKHIIMKKEKKKGTLRLKGNYLQMNNDRKSSLAFQRQNSVLTRPQLKFNLKKMSGKGGSSIPPLEYSNSFTRLFIGETDEASIRERYLSNMIVKKQKQLHLLNSYSELSVMYLKKMYKKLFKHEGQKGQLDNDMINLISQFENDHKRIDIYHKNYSNSEKPPHYMYDYNQNLLAAELDKQRENLNKHKKRNIESKLSKNKYTNVSKSFYGSKEVSKNNNEINFRLFDSRKNEEVKKMKYNSINFNKSKKSNDIMFDKRIINSYGNYKLLYYKRYNFDYPLKRLKRNMSALLGRERTRIYPFSSSNKKNNTIKNYMNKSDFFFS